MTHEDINTLARFCGPRDVPALTGDQLTQAIGAPRADVMALFGGSILHGGDVLAQAMKNGAAKTYMIVGGAGHTTQTLRDTVRRLYPSIETADQPEAVIFDRYIRHRYGLSADLLETASTNCGNNITFMLRALEERGVPHESFILCQDATMQRRMAAGLQKYAPDIRIVNFASYRATVLPDMTYRETPLGMWEMERYLSLLLGEIPRLAHDGYGPGGKGYIAHVDIPEAVREAFERLRRRYPALVRKGNPEFAG